MPRDWEVFGRAAEDLPVTRHSPSADYPYRASASSLIVATALTGALRSVTYDNFKDSVREADRHDAYFEVWATMVAWGKGAFRKRAAIGAMPGARKRRAKR